MNNYIESLVCSTTEASFTEVQASPVAEVSVAKNRSKKSFLRRFLESLSQSGGVRKKINPKNLVFDRCFLNYILIGG